MQLDIEGKTAVVVGASRGIGRATAQLLAREGANVALVARNQDQLEQLSAQIGGETRAFAADMSKEAEAEAVLARIKETMGAPQILVWSVTALFDYGKIHNISYEAIADELRREVGIPALMCKLLLPDMMRARFGRIVFVGSLAASIGSKGAPIYCVSKASLEALCRSTAIDYSRYGITANVARLGFTDTERLRKRIEGEPERAERYAKAMSTNRLVQPDEAAHAIAFLCSRLAGSITGSVLDVTGGLQLANNW